MPKEQAIEIREIEEKDYPAVLSLWNNELGNRRVTAENIAPHYGRIKDDSRYKTFVALLDGKVTGLVSSVWSYAVGFDAGFMHITGIAVNKEAQGTGVGAKLLSHMENYAKSLGICTILLACGVKRTDAHAFYERNGYNKNSWCFDKSL